MASVETHPLRWLILVSVSSLFLVLLMGCGCDSSPTSAPPPTPAPRPIAPAGSRDRLTVDELFGGPAPGVVHNSYYQPLGQAGPAVGICGTVHMPTGRRGLESHHVNPAQGLRMQSRVRGMRSPAATISKSPGKRAARSRVPSRPSHLARVKRSLWAVVISFTSQTTASSRT